MTPSPSGRYLADAREELRQVRDWLSQPSAETMAACPPALERALANLREVACGSNPALVQPLLQLIEELNSTQALLHAAGALYFGRLSHLAAAAAHTPAVGVPSTPISLIG